MDKTDCGSFSRWISTDGRVTLQPSSCCVWSVRSSSGSRKTFSKKTHLFLGVLLMNGYTAKRNFCAAAQPGSSAASQCHCSNKNQSSSRFISHIDLFFTFHLWPVGERSRPPPSSLRERQPGCCKRYSTGTLPGEAYMAHRRSPTGTGSLRLALPPPSPRALIGHGDKCLNEHSGR